MKKIILISWITIFVLFTIFKLMTIPDLCYDGVDIDEEMIIELCGMDHDA